MNPSRRNILKQLLVGVGASVVLPANGTLSPSSQPKFYQAEEFELLSRLSDLIIPATDTPGALEAQVPPTSMHYLVNGRTVKHSRRKGIVASPSRRTLG